MTSLKLDEETANSKRPSVPDQSKKRSVSSRISKGLKKTSRVKSRGAKKYKTLLNRVYCCCKARSGCVATGVIEIVLGLITIGVVFAIRQEDHFVRALDEFPRSFGIWVTFQRCLAILSSIFMLIGVFNYAEQLLLPYLIWGSIGVVVNAAFSILLAVTVGPASYLLWSLICLEIYGLVIVYSEYADISQKQKTVRDYLVMITEYEPSAIQPLPSPRDFDESGILFLPSRLNQQID